VYRVTKLGDDGSPGTLRHALGAGNRCVVFAVGGTITLGRHISSTAPFPAPFVATTDACTAAKSVRAGAGARGTNFGPDSVDQSYIGSIPASPPGC
jgi:hypothetical protein